MGTEWVWLETIERKVMCGDEDGLVFEYRQQQQSA